MIITLYTTPSEPNRVNKVLQNETELIGTIKDASNMVTPEILCRINNNLSYNYAYILEFGRYYYIRDMEVGINGLSRIRMESDPLMSFKDDLMQCAAVLSDTENLGTQYLESNVFRSLVKDTTSIISFGGGLNTNGEYILITAGG